MSDFSNLNLRKHGICTLKSVVSDAFLEWLAQGMARSKAKSFAIKGEQIAPAISQSADSSKTVYLGRGVFMQQDLLAWLAREEVFKLLSLEINEDLSLANNMAFEIDTEKKSGLAWHAGIYSFSYIPLATNAWTIWIPLDPITADQRGGLQLVSTSDLDGSYIYQLADDYYYKSLLQAKQKNLIGEKYVDWVSKFDHPFQKIDACLSQELDSSQIYEPWLMPGDALIFDKFVVHRSSPFLPGNLRRRRGIALRVIPSLSVFDRKRFYPFAKHILQLASYDSSLLEPEKRDWFFERLLSERLHHGQELLALSGLLAKI